MSSSINNSTSKIVLAGTCSVGKSSLIEMLINKHFSETIPNTVGLSFFTKQYSEHNFTHTLNIWDTPGQDRFSAYTKSYFRNSDAIVILVAVDSEESVDEARRIAELALEIKSTSGLHFLVINKIDLLKYGQFDTTKGDELYKRCSFYDKILQLEKQFSFEKTFWTSAKELETVEVLFEGVHKHLMNEKILFGHNISHAEGVKDIVNLKVDKKSKSNGGCC